MIIATHGIIASQLAGFDADAQAFFDRVTTAGGTLSATEKTAVNQLVLDMKSYSIWSKMKAIYPMVGASSAACAQNLKSSSFTGSFTSGWTFASTGVTPNGTSAYMNTSLTPNGNVSQNSTHLSFYSRTNKLADGMDIGVFDGVTTSGLHLGISYGGTSNQMRSRCNSSTASTSYTPTDTRGLFLISRVNSTEFKGYRNNSSVFTLSASSIAPVNINISIGAITTTLGQSDYSTHQCAFSSIGDGLTDTEASNFYTAVQAFQTTLSRNV